MDLNMMNRDFRAMWDRFPSRISSLSSFSTGGNGGSRIPFSPRGNNSSRLPEHDPTAVENPISALFDLAEQVSEKAPYVRKNFWYSILFVGLWLGFSIVMLLSVLFSGLVVAALIFLFICVSGVVAFRMLYFDHKFFDYFSRRYNAIKLVRDGNPFRYMPQGDTPVERLLNHLMETHELLHRILQKYPETLRPSAIIKGRSGAAYRIDAYLEIPGKSHVWKDMSRNLGEQSLPVRVAWRGASRRGYALFIKVFDTAPTLREITALEQAVNDVTALTGIPPRVIALTEGGTGELPEDLYRHITEESVPVTVRKGIVGRKTFGYTVQTVSGVDGCYDMVPFIASGALP